MTGDLLPSALREFPMISALTVSEGRGLGVHSVKSPKIHSMWGGSDAAVAVKHLSFLYSLWRLLLCLTACRRDQGVLDLQVAKERIPLLGSDENPVSGRQLLRSCLVVAG